jgi:hypothetical protein
MAMVVTVSISQLVASRSWSHLAVGRISQLVASRSWWQLADGRISQLVAIGRWQMAVSVADDLGAREFEGVIEEANLDGHDAPNLLLRRHRERRRR